MIERVLRVASSFREAAELDRRDVAAMSFEDRISGVERLRRVWFGEAHAPKPATRGRSLRRRAAAPRRKRKASK